MLVLQARPRPCQAEAVSQVVSAGHPLSEPGQLKLLEPQRWFPAGGGGGVVRGGSEGRWVVDRQRSLLQSGVHEWGGEDGRGGGWEVGGKGYCWEEG